MDSQNIFSYLMLRSYTLIWLLITHGLIMAFTWQKKHEVLNHVLMNLFQLMADSPLALALVAFV